MTRKFMVIGLFAFLFAFSTTAFADVTFNSQSGMGFVGKGDVQSAFGWNNAELQQNYTNVTFTFMTEVTYSATCTSGTGQETVQITDQIEADVTRYVDFTARMRKQVTGFILIGYMAIVLGENTPILNAPCTANGSPGVWTDVDIVNTTEIGLFVNYGGSSVQLYY
jgi:hypothetical protein